MYGPEDADEDGIDPDGPPLSLTALLSPTGPPDEDDEDDKTERVELYRKLFNRYDFNGSETLDTVEEVESLAINTVMRLGLSVNPEIFDNMLKPLIAQVEAGKNIHIDQWLDFAEDEL